MAADNDLHLSLSEGSTFATASRLRFLLTEIIFFYLDAHPLDLWHAHKIALCEDATYILHQTSTEAPTEEQIQSVALRHIKRLLQLQDKSLEDFGLPLPIEIQKPPIVDNPLIAQELDYDTVNLSLEANEMKLALNPEQLHIVTEILHAYECKQSAIFFVDGPGGTGKTYLQKVLLNTIRSHGAIAFAVASSGMAATLLPGG